MIARVMFLLGLFGLPSSMPISGTGVGNVAVWAGPAVQTIEDQHKNLGRLQQALQALRHADGAQQRKVRIALYGDSNHSMDWAAGALRAELSARFGAGGHGFVAAGQPWPWYQHTEIKVRTSGDVWRAYAVTSPRHGRFYGHAGILGSGEKAGAFVEFRSTAQGVPGDRIFSRVEVFYRCLPRGGRIGVHVDGMRLGEIETTCDQSTLRTSVWNVVEGPHVVRLTAERSPVYVYGASFENSANGVVVDGLGVGALNDARLDAIAPEDFETGLRGRQYDAVFLHTGTNMWSPKMHPVWAGRVIDRIRRALGEDVSILLLSPADFGRRKDGQIIGEPRMEACTKEKREIAASHRVAFWDYYAAMGGRGSVASWYARGVVSYDLIHFRPDFHAAMMSTFAQALDSKLAP